MNTKEKEVDATLKFMALAFRAWYYFRLGYTQYLNFFVGFFTFVSATYYLAISQLPFLKEVFPNFYLFIIFGVLVIIPLGVSIGWLHMKRTLAYPTEQTISVESNPYMYTVLPGKEKELWAPAWLLLLRAMRKTLEKEDILSAEEKREFENIAAKLEKLLKGEVIGVPRQRQVLAILKREKESMK